MCYVHMNESILNSMNPLLQYVDYRKKATLKVNLSSCLPKQTVTFEDKVKGR